ncbi:hypothetical protein PG984_009093, partial [Apiospora sp. TS-2023a]
MHPSVLQGLIVLRCLYRSRPNAHKASECFYKASTLNQVILSKLSPTVVSCSNIFLACSEQITFTSRTAIFTYREEMVRFIINLCKGQHRAQSDVVIRWYKVLAKLYVDINKEYMAAMVYKELQEITADSQEGRTVRKDLAGINIVLKKSDGSLRSVSQVKEAFFESVEDLERTDEIRIAVLLRLAQSISQACRRKATNGLRIGQINIKINYARFLERYKRIDKARNILLCLWAEYEHLHFKAQSIIVHFKELAISGSGSTRIKKVEDKEAISTTVIITELVEKITETITETTVYTEVTETTTRDIFEAVYTKSKASHADRHFYKSCLSLASIYTVLVKSLDLVWKCVLTTDNKTKIEGEFVSERITAATRLATCYQHQGYLEKADQIYFSVYKACITSLEVEHSCFTEAIAALIAFYQEYHQGS